MVQYASHRLTLLLEARSFKTLFNSRLRFEAKSESVLWFEPCSTTDKICSLEITMADVTNVATKLADLKLFSVLLESEQKLIAQTDDNTICERLEGMIKSDRENLASKQLFLNTAILPNHATLLNNMLRRCQMMGVELTLYDKYLQLELASADNDRWFYTRLPSPE